MSDAAAGPSQQQIYKVAVASIIGSVIEQYDFLVTGVIAATVWGGVFFKEKGLAAVSAAITVYGLGIIIRPIGAFIFGHIADRQGRKDAMVYALVLMGLSTLAIGLTPFRRFTPRIFRRAIAPPPRAPAIRSRRSTAAG